MSIEIPEEPHGTAERWATGLLISVAIALHTTALLNAKPLQSANDRSRWCTVWSLVERGTFQIDEIREYPGWDSIDKIYDGGHYYSTKPPLLTVIVAGLTAGVQKATGWKLLNYPQPVTAAVLFLINIVPFALSLALLSRLLRRVCQTSWCRLFVLSAAAFGTLVTPYLMTLNNHTVAVVGVIISLFALERVLTDESPRGWSFALCGLGAGWACANELPAAALGLVTFFLAANRSLRKTLCWYAPAALIPLAAFFATNQIATGSFKPTYASYGSAKYNYVVDGIPSYWMDPDGVDRNLDSPAVYFLHCTIGHHGIFSLTPIFLLVLAGWGASPWIRNVALKRLIQAGALISGLVIGFYMTRFDNYNYGGVSCGLRWALWLIPFWLLALVPVVDAVARLTVSRMLLVGLLGLSIFSAWLPIENPWQQPWLFRRMEAWKWIDYTRKPPELSRKLWTWFPTVPNPGATAEEAPWIEFSSQSVDGSIRRRRLTSRKPTSGDPGLVELEVSEAIDEGDLKPVRTMLIDAQKFHEGAATADFVRWSNPASLTTAQKQADLTFVRGLPLKEPYRPGKIRYLRLPIRNDAFRCQLAAAAVNYPHDDPLYQYRCDTWLCDEFPFGVAQFEIRVIDTDLDAVVQHERWTVTECYPEVAAQAPTFPGAK